MATSSFPLPTGAAPAPTPAPAHPPLRRLSLTDRLLAHAQMGLPGAAPARAARPSPADLAAAPVPALDPAERRLVAGLMRINHAGEVAAQGLYHGQAWLAKSPALRAHLLHAAEEEHDHLGWCADRLVELGAEPSRFSGFWYLGSVAIGALAALKDDATSLGFVEETERQVSDHLTEHLERLPPQDERSREILSVMRTEEERHGAEARAAGGRDLYPPERFAMRQVSKVMKAIAFHV